jgi:hypothetical protein
MHYPQVRIITRSHPVLTLLTPVYRLLTYTHPRVPLRYEGHIKNWPCRIMGLSTAERTGSPVLHTLWSYVLDLALKGIL